MKPQPITSIKDERVVEATEDEILHDFTELEKGQLFDYMRRIQANCQQLRQSSV